MTEATDADYEKFFQDFRVFEEKRNAQKARGLNDYSLITSLLSSRDEVRLHSRFLYSFLNPKGKHYQGTLFLELFLKAIGLNGELDISQAVVHKELSAEGLKGSIDLVITDGERWILIENKLNAQDQKTQAKRYIEHVVYNENVSSGDLFFIYLTINDYAPGSKSLGDLQGPDRNGTIKKNGMSLCKFLSIHYKYHVKNWVKECLAEVGNIRNLSNALMEYDTVLDRVYRQYRSQVMGIEEFMIDENGKLDKERYRIAEEMARSLPAVKATLLDNLMSESVPEFVARLEGEVVPISGEEIDELKGHDYKSDHATNFFAETGKAEDNKNKGVFWEKDIEGGFGLLVSVVFGSKNIHVGVLPLVRKDGDPEKWEFAPQKAKTLEDKISEFQRLKSVHKEISFKSGKSIKAPFPGMVSCDESMKECISSFSEFGKTWLSDALEVIFGFIGSDKAKEVFQETVVEKE